MHTQTEHTPTTRSQKSYSISLARTHKHTQGRQTGNLAVIFMLAPNKPTSCQLPSHQPTRTSCRSTSARGRCQIYSQRCFRNMSSHYFPHEATGPILAQGPRCAYTPRAIGSWRFIAPQYDAKTGAVIAEPPRAQDTCWLGDRRTAERKFQQFENFDSSGH